MKNIRLPNTAAKEHGFRSGDGRFNGYQLAFPPTIVNNAPETVIRTPVALNSQIVILSEHQKIQNI